MRSLNIPILSSDRADYIEGNDYETRVFPSDAASFHIRHEVTGNNLVSHLLSKGDALFAAEACAPASTYRQIFVHRADGSTSCAQEIQVDECLIVQPLYVRPLIIFDINRTLEIFLDQSYGVHEIWQGERIFIRNAAILGLGGFSSRAGIHSLLKLIEDKDLPEGAFSVRPNSSDGFHFEMCVSHQLFHSIRNPADQDHRDSLLTAALASGLHYLKSDLANEDEWHQHVALTALHKYLKDMNLPTWDDEDFNADEVATKLKPIRLAGLGDDR